MNGINLSTISDLYIGSTQYSAIYLGSTLVWQRQVTPIDYSTEYLTFESLQDNNVIGFKASNSSYLKTIQVSTDKTNWTSYTSSTSGTTLATLNTGDKLYVRGSNNQYYVSSYRNYFTSTKNFNVSGNIMSLIYSDNFIGQTTLTNDYTFCYLFRESDVINASNLILPAATLTVGCYSGMFFSCTSLTTAPELPATTLVGPYPPLPFNCYAFMFYGCTSLTTAPELPATTLVSGCYDSMFSGCTSLTTAPSLPATTLANNCYSNMFSDCSSLTTAPSLPATTLATTCYASMFSGCSSLTTAPVLPATTLAQGCYQFMFCGCSSLNYIKMLATDISASYCLDNWVEAVASTGTFVKEYGVDIPINSDSGIPTGWTVQEINNPTEQYLTFKILSDGNIYWRANGSVAKTIEYSLNDGTWTEITSSTTPAAIPVVTDDIVRFRGTNATYATSNTKYSGFGHGEVQSGTQSSYDENAAEFEVRGNIMSLIYGDNFASQTSLGNTIYNFCSLFKKAKVVSAKNLVLPATTLTGYCYRAMFSMCTYLTSAPVLPATTLATYCYYYMFDHCSITTAPELPATTLATYCYRYMFLDCTSLTTAPELPATTLASYCYANMFANCTSLTTAPSTLPATTLVGYCYASMFSGCSSLTTAPELPALTLVSYCYQYMFNNCSSLNYIKMLATDISASRCLYTWVAGVASTGTFVKNTNATWTTTGVSGIPTGWTVQLYNPSQEEYFTIESLENNNTIGFKTNDSSLLRTIQVSTDKTNWISYTSSTSGITLSTLNTGAKLYVRGNNNYYATSNSIYNYFTSSGQFNVTGNIMSLIYGDNFISQTTFPNSSTWTFSRLFEACSNLIDASNLILPATTLTDYCYKRIFENCSSLTTAPELPATTLAYECYEAMFENCSSLTTAPELPATTLAQGCYEGMFVRCTHLVTPPELPAIGLKQRCYMNMFLGCTSLTTAPELPARTLINRCYEGMFYNCSSLNYIKSLFTTTPSTTYTNSWVSGVASTGTFVKSIDATWDLTGVHGVPSGWTVQYYDPTVFSNASIKVYDNYNTGTGYNAIQTLSAGNNTTIGTSGKWYYGNNRYIYAYINGQKVSTSSTYKLNVVITGLSEFKVALKGTSNICSCLLEKLNDNSSISYSDFSSSNTHTQVYSENTVTEYTYTDLDPNTKYNIVFYLRANATNSSYLLVPQTYPLPEIIKNTNFTSSSDYTEIYG